MIVHYDKTLSPNKKLIKYVKELASKHGIPYQSDSSVEEEQMLEMHT